MRPSPKLVLFAAMLAATALAAPAVLAHCQVPCGIYGDQTRVDLLREHVTAIEKSMTQVVALGKASPVSHNQVVRWVINKEQHADELSEIVTYYFMTQRIVPPADGDEAAAKKYQHELGLLHRMLVHSMKAKQTTDKAHIEALREAIDAFEASYMGENKGHSH
ncbi:MAG: superoxide dismutase, Ni [Holophagales bacterium]|nr:superoxide dismutase, Ni [Holophagales bacterium]